VNETLRKCFTLKLGHTKVPETNQRHPAVIIEKHTEGFDGLDDHGILEVFVAGVCSLIAVVDDLDAACSCKGFRDEFNRRMLERVAQLPNMSHLCTPFPPKPEIELPREDPDGKK